MVYVSNQGGAVPAGAGYVVVQGTPGTAGPVPVQPYPVANYPGMATQPMHMQVPQAFEHSLSRPVEGGGGGGRGLMVPLLSD